MWKKMFTLGDFLYLNTQLQSKKIKIKKKHFLYELLYEPYILIRHKFLSYCTVFHLIKFDVKSGHLTAPVPIQLAIYPYMYCTLR